VRGAGGSLFAQVAAVVHVVIFGLTVSSSWGNGHATLWRGLIKALGQRGHRVTFFERDADYYARHRDVVSLPGHQLVLYADWDDVSNSAREAISSADVAMVTSYCPDGPLASRLVLGSPTALRVYYDMDAPVTLERLASGERVPYLPPDGLAGFDLVLSYAGGETLDALEQQLGARRVLPLYGSVDPDLYTPAPPVEEFTASLSHLGTYAADRHDALDRLFLARARARPGRRFLLGGPKYPGDFAWQPNIFYRAHVAPPEHPAFYSSSVWTLNVTRGAMARYGYCPSGRLFEAAACGVPILTDRWPGLDVFFTPGVDLLAVDDTRDVLAAFDLPDGERLRMARSARDRTLDEHSALARVRDFERACDLAASA
jgi:spore maturation protein CgeB